MQIIDIFKEMHPEYANWTDDELKEQLPPWVMYWKPPQAPHVPTYYKYDLFQAMFMGLLFYLAVIPARSTVWAVKYLKKENVK
jgi:hypothetical protein